MDNTMQTVSVGAIGAVRSPLGAFLLNKRSAATRAAYAADLGAFVAYLGAGGETFAAIIAAGVESIIGWRDAQTEAGLAPATVARRLSTLRTFFRFAVASGATDRNPAELVEAPRVEAARQRAEYLEAADARRLLAVVSLADTRGLRDRAILGLLACSGLRRAEVAGLILADLRAEAAGLTATVEGKGGKVRTLDVDRATAEALLGYLAATDREAGGAGFVFIGRCDRSHLSVDAIDHLVAAYGRRAGLAGERLAPHALRRTFATVALDRGASLDALRRAMGHADPRTTARYDRRREATVTVAY